MCEFSESHLRKLKVSASCGNKLQEFINLRVNFILQVTNFKEYVIISKFIIWWKRILLTPYSVTRCSWGARSDRWSPGPQGARQLEEALTPSPGDWWPWGLKWVLVHGWGEAQGTLGPCQSSLLGSLVCFTLKKKHFGFFFFSDLWIFLV